MASQFAALESGARPALSVSGGVAWARERWAALSLAAVALLSGTWALMGLAWPMGFDHGLYTWTSDVVIRGGLPYRDSWDMHGPLVPYLYALPRAVFGPRFWGVRVLDLLILGASLYALYRLLATVCSRTAAVWAVAVFPLCYASTGFNETAQPDGWVGLVLMAAVVPLLVRTTPGIALVFASGLAVGAGALVKPVFAAFLLVPFVCLFNGGRPAWKALAGRTVVMGIGFLIPIAATAAWFVSQSGLSYLVEVHLAYTSQVYSPLASLDLQARVRGLLDYIWTARVVAVAQPAVLLGAFALRRSHPGVFRALVTWVVLGVALVMLQNKYYIYHWHIILPPLAALAAAGLHSALSARGATRDARLLAVVLMGVIVVHAVLRPGLRLLDDVRYAVGALDKQAYYGRFHSDSFEPAAIREVGTYIRGRTTPADQVAIYGFDAGILYESGRESAFRMAGWSWPVTEGEGSPIREEYRREYLASMDRTRPTYVVVNRGAGNEETSPTLLPPALTGFPELASVIQSRYRYERHFGRYTLYRRADAAPR